MHEWETTRPECFPEHAGKACNAWELYREDIASFRELGWQVYRMSIEWSRLEPEEGVHDQEALARYQDMLRLLNEAGIKVVVTLHHWTHPLWFEKIGGFAKRENIHYFIRHLEWLLPQIKDSVYMWVLLNEFTNHGVKCSGFDLMKNLTIAHAYAYHTVKQYSNAPAASTHAMIPWHPYRALDEFDQCAAKLLDWQTNGFFIHAMETGELLLPYTAGVYIPEVKDSFDFWGINYYTRHMASARTEDLHTCRYEFDRISMIDYDFYLEEFYPDAFVSDLMRYRNKPVWICENGVCADDDRIRLVYLCRHMAALSEAIRQGLDLHGYLYWSAMDNFEWGTYKPRFGLIHVDFETFRRTPKPSAYFYREIIRNHGITGKMIQKWITPLSDIKTYSRPLREPD